MGTKNDITFKPTFNNYDKLADDVCFLGKNIIVRINAGLSHKDKDGKRDAFYKEYAFNNSGKYTNQNVSVTLRRSFDYFISIENLKKNEYEEKEFMKITLQDIYLFRMQLREVAKWFLSNEYGDVFVINKNGVMKVGRDISKIITVRKSSIGFRPAMVEGYDNKNYPGVEIYLNNTYNTSYATAEEFFGLYEFIEKCDMFGYGQGLVNSFMVNANLGDNVVIMGEIDPAGEVNGVKGRQIPITKSDKFFD